MYRIQSTGVFLLLAFTATVCRAEKEYPDCEKTFFQSGQLSTQKCFDKAHRFGKAYAYNTKGEVIYEKDLRTIGGHASVYFTFYTSGAVKRADWSSAPDAGIQWYSSRDEFSEEGKLTFHTTQNYDDYIRLKAPLNKTEKDTEILVKAGKSDTILTHKKKVETWFINHTWYPIFVTTLKKNELTEMSEKKILPGDSIMLVNYDFTLKNNEPSRKYQFKLIAAENDAKQQPVVKTISRRTRPNKNIAYYYVVENKSRP